MDENTQAYRVKQWMGILNDCAQSGLKKAYCEAHGINEKTFYYWQRRLRDQLAPVLHAQIALQQRQPSSEQTTFAELVPTTSTAHQRRRESPYCTTAKRRSPSRRIWTKLSCSNFCGCAAMLDEPGKLDSIYIACGYTDLRKSIDGLAQVVQEQFQLDPFFCSLFLFCGRRRDRMKALLWEKDGFLLLHKRLEGGKYQWPRTSADVRKLTTQEYRRLLEGLSPDQPKANKAVQPAVF